MDTLLTAVVGCGMGWYWLRNFYFEPVTVVTHIDDNLVDITLVDTYDLLGMVTVLRITGLNRELNRVKFYPRTFVFRKIGQVHIASRRPVVNMHVDE